MRSKLLEDLKRIERIDQLIRLKATGKPRDLAKLLGISETSLYTLLNTMKEMGAQIYYSTQRCSYCYEDPTRFVWGFQAIDVNKIMGGNGNFNISLPNFWSTIPDIDVN